VLIVIMVFLYDGNAQRRAAYHEEGRAMAAGGESPAFPVPPIDLPHYHGDLETTSTTKEVTGV
jgi:hypothetical protein